MYERHFVPSSVSLMFFLSMISLSRSEGICRNLKFQKIAEDKAVTNNNIRTIHPISDVDTCRRDCFLESRCLSINFCTKSDGTLSCDLIKSDHIRSVLVDTPGCIHYGSENACSSSPCLNNATCLGDFDYDPVPYRCICPAGYTGPVCNEDIDECKSSAHDCHVNANCTNTEDGYNCTCNKGYFGNGRQCEVIETCAEMSSTLSDSEKTTELFHRVKPKGVGYSVLCSYSNAGCGSGTWKLALKIDGKKKNFKYDSLLWTDKNLQDPAAALTGLVDDSETKTLAYWNIPLTKLCLGMKYGGVTRWISINITAPSLQSLMSSNVEKLTSLGEPKWRSLLPAGIISLHETCKKEGFNLKGGTSNRVRRLRLGFFTDNDDCASYMAFIGVGSRLDSVPGNVNGDGFSCGNFSPTFSVDNGARYNTAFCFILVQ